VACQPFFDDCEDAFFLGSFTGNINYNTNNATTDGPGHVACSGGGNVQIFNDVWFDWIAPCSGTVTLQTCGLADFDTKIAIYQDCSCNELGPNLLGCNDNAPNCANQGSRLNVPVVEDQCYKIRVGGAGAAEGSGQLNITCNAAPPNDDCDDASLTFLGIPTPFTTENSFTDGVHHAECGSQIVHDVWFRRTATCTGFMTVSTCGTADFDTMIAVYDDCECPATDAELIGCNNDAPNCAGNGSRVTVPVYEGRCYLVRIGAPPIPVLTEGGSQGETGSGSVTFSCFETCEGDANVNGIVDVDDLLMVINNWGNCDADETCLGDLTGNGVVDVDDLLEVINNWGPCFPT
jgi:hypothetical protein